MAKIIQKVLKEDVVAVAFRCDVCGKEYDASDDAVFSLTHTCGFASDFNIFSALKDGDFRFLG